MTITKTAIKVITNSKKDIMTHKELVSTVSKLLNVSYESTRGTLLISQDKIRNICEKSNSTYLNSGKDSVIVKNGKENKYEGKLNTQKYSYNSASKQTAREFIYSHFKGGNILTFGGDEGLDIKYVLDNLQHREIHNLERCEKLFKKYLELPFSRNTKNFNTTLYKHLSNNKTRYNLINYDSISYLCSKVANDIEVLNNSNSDTIALTLCKVENGARNHGKFADYLRNTYSKNTTTNYLKDSFTNYRMIATHSYKRTTRSQQMVIYIFERK